MLLRDPQNYKKNKTCSKIKCTPLCLSSKHDSKTFHFFIFIVQICSRGCSWQNRCTDFQEICYSAAPFLSYPVILDSKYWGHSTIFGFEKSNENYHFFSTFNFPIFLAEFLLELWSFNSETLCWMVFTGF